MGKACYDSDYGADGKITAEQKLAEVMCLRIAQAQGRSLFFKFWRDPGWEKVFKAQLRNARALLRVYDVEAISAALTKNAWIRSLAYPKLGELASEEQRRIDRTIEASREQVDEARTPPPATPPGDAAETAPPPPRARRSIRSRLEGV